MRSVIFALCVLFSLALAQEVGTGEAFVQHDTDKSWDFIRKNYGPFDQSSPKKFFTDLMKNLVKAIPPELIKDRPYPPPVKTETPKHWEAFGPWFAWIPPYTTTAMLNAPASTQTWTAPCFQNNSISAVLDNANSATLTITTTNPTSLLCSDWYLIATVEGLHIHTFSALSSVGVTTLNWNFSASITPAEMEDVKRNGFRVFRFMADIVTTLIDLYDTAMLFLPALEGPSIPPATEQANLQFLANYSAINMEARTMTSPIYIDPSLVKSGDFFGVIRLDGLDPMLAWAMGGSRTGHTTIALNIDGAMHVCESTTKDSYWPTNGIQCTPLTQWITQADAAYYNTVWVPLSDENRAKFNETAAVEFVKANLNLDYGFGNLLWGWMDNLQDYPFPLPYQLHQLLPALAGKLVPAVSELLWNRAFRLRLGLPEHDTSINTAQIYADMYTKGLDFNALTFIPEMDSWQYTQNNNFNQTVQGKSMVCDVFVCELLKAGGIFGNTDFQCAEATNWDIYTLNIFNPNPTRPAACVAADPNLPFCQITGRYRLELPNWNTRQIFPNSFNNCPRGSPPDWMKPVGC